MSLSRSYLFSLNVILLKIISISEKVSKMLSVSDGAITTIHNMGKTPHAYEIEIIYILNHYFVSLL